MQVVNIFFSAVKSMQKILADDTFCACIATAVDFRIQVQMNQWKIVWLPVWIKCDILSGVVLYLIRVLTEIKFEIWRVAFLNIWDDFRFQI